MEKHIEEQLQVENVALVLEEITIDELTRREEYAACATVNK